MKVFMAVMILLFSISSTGFCATYSSSWDKNNNGWLYWDETGITQPGGWVLHDLPMPHRSTGGETGGYVYCDLNEAGLWMPDVEDVYWPAYMVDSDLQNPSMLGDLSDHHGMIYTNNLDSGDIRGGSLHFFVGEYIVGSGGSGSLKSDSSGTWTWYLLRDPIDIGDNKWQQNFFTISSNPHDWIMYDHGAHLTLEHILDSPQQMGFAIIDTRGEPMGELGFDRLVISPYPLPEPSLAMLFIIGIGWIIKRIRYHNSN